MTAIRAAPPRSTAPWYRRWQPGSKTLSLRRGMILLLFAALLPITILSIVQGLVRLESRRAAVVEQLSESAVALAESNQTILDSTESLLRVLAADPRVRAVGADCNAVLAGAIAVNPANANFTRYDPAGRVVCAALPPTASSNINDAAWWAMIRARQDIFVSDAVWGPSSNRRVMVMVLPLRTAAGEFDGALSASIDLGWLAERLGTRITGDRTGVAIISDSGQVLIASRALPRFDITLPPGQIGRIRSGATTWSYTVVPLVLAGADQNGLHVVYASPEPARFGLIWWQTLVDFALPVLAILLASFAIWIGTQRLVLRWLLSLQRLALQYAGGDYRRRPVSFTDAPAEIRSVVASLYRMSSAIGERDRRLRDALHRQHLLAREVHHRVKNNFQVVMSLLSLQSSRLADENARRAIDQARRRISALALVHRQLYDGGELTRVSSRALLTALCEQLKPRHALGPALDCSTGFDDVQLDIDHAVPLTLWLVETVNNALHHGYPADRSGTVTVTFRTTIDTATLTISDDGIGFDPAEAAGDGHGLRLIRALAAQLGGTATVTRLDPGSEARLDFPLEAEAGELDSDTP